MRPSTSVGRRPPVAKACARRCTSVAKHCRGNLKESTATRQLTTRRKFDPFSWASSAAAASLLRPGVLSAGGRRTSRQLHPTSEDPLFETGALTRAYRRVTLPTDDNWAQVLRDRLRKRSPLIELMGEIDQFELSPAEARFFGHLRTVVGFPLHSPTVLSGVSTPFTAARSPAAPSKGDESERFFDELWSYRGSSRAWRRATGFSPDGRARIREIDTRALHRARTQQ